LLALGCGFTRKNFRNRIQWGLIPQKSFAEMYKDGGVENTVGVEVEVLDAVVPPEPLEEVARREREPALRESREHRDLVFTLLHRVRIPGGGPPHVHLLLPDESAVEEASRSSVLAFDFFHSRFGSGRGGDIGGAAPAADPAASSWLLFFPLAAFAILDGDGFILQVQGVFTRIRSGATAVALSGGALGSTLHLAVAARTGGDFWPRCV
jgi:hypothetical protein